MPNFNSNGSYSNRQSNLFLRQRSLNTEFHSLNSSNSNLSRVFPSSDQLNANHSRIGQNISQFPSNNNISRVINQSNVPETNVFLNANSFDLNSRVGQNNRVISQFQFQSLPSNSFLNPRIGQNNGVISQFPSNNNISRVINQSNVPDPNAYNQFINFNPGQMTNDQSQRGPNSIEASYLPLQTQYSVQTSLECIGGKLCLAQTVKETRKLLGPPMSTQNQVNHPIVANGPQPTQSQNPNPHYYNQQQQPIYQNTPNPSPGNLSGQGDNIDMPEEGYDGMTHSLPCEKYGPYTCPSCNEVFNTPHLFASHVATHYKYESAEQRRRRHMARSRRKKPSDGIAPVVQQPFKRQQQSGSNNYVLGDFGRFGVPKQ